MLRRLVARALLTLTIGIAIATIAVLFWPSSFAAVIFPAGLKIVGRSECSWERTLYSQDEIGRISDLRASIERSAHRVATDGTMQLWEVPNAGRFWLAGPFTTLNALVFAEEAVEIYRQDEVRVRPGDFVLDCGADYGAFTRRALSAGARKVLVIEIAPSKWQCLRRTFAAEIADGRVVIVERGVWDHDDTVQLDGDSVLLARGQTKIAVPVTTIDQIVATAGLPRVDFVKMDIEGAEKRALRGAAETLRKFRPRMAIAAEHFPDDYRELPRTVREILPEYRVACGWCGISEGRVLPEVLYFN